MLPCERIYGSFLRPTLTFLPLIYEDSQYFRDTHENSHGELLTIRVWIYVVSEKASGRKVSQHLSRLMLTHENILP
jgi:hypothetical protein